MALGSVLLIGGFADPLQPRERHLQSQGDFYHAVRGPRTLYLADSELVSNCLRLTLLYEARAPTQ